LQKLIELLVLALQEKPILAGTPSDALKLANVAELNQKE